MPSIIRVLALTTAIVALVAPPARAADDRTNDAPTGWHWIVNTSAGGVVDWANAHGERVIDIEVRSTNPLRFDAILVKNTGSYARSWWLYIGNESLITAKVEAKNARIVDLESWRSDGKPVIAAVMVTNAGSNAASWWWYHNVTKSYLDARITEHGARLVDLDSTVVGDSRRWHGAMIANTGANARNWHYYYNRTVAQVNDLLKDHASRLYDIEPREGTNPQRFDVVMVRNTGGGATTWWWYYGKSESEMLDLAAQNGARIFDIERYVDSGGQTVHAGVMIRNVDDNTLRVNELMRAKNSTGFWGFYLKQVDGPGLGSINARRQFEGASMMKVVYHLNTMREYQNKLVDLMTDTMTVSVSENPQFTDTNGVPQPGNGCPDGATTNNLTISNTLQTMMQNSDNRSTDAILNRQGGQDTLESFAHNTVKMTNTEVNHRIGCPLGPGEGPNRLTLRDLGVLYEGVVAGDLLKPTAWGTFRSLMNTSILGRAQAIIEGRAAFTKNGVTYEKVDGEAQDLGVSASQRKEFLDGVQMTWKPGSYQICGSDCSNANSKFHAGVAGVLRLPWRKPGGGLQYRSYAFGLFTNDSTTPTGAALARDRALEVLRPTIRAALKSWLAKPRITIPNPPHPVNGTDSIFNNEFWTFNPPVTRAPVPPSPPDLVISALSATSFTVTNQGGTAASAFTVTVGGVGTFAISGLAPGESQSPTYRCITGNHLATADSANAITESDESNNTRTIGVRICGR